jgi:protoporphyrinogen/coproporphyrinogen III oxidase
MSPIKNSIVVVGGGITGLAAARAILETSDALVTLAEASDRLGGKVWTEKDDGVTYEWGADSFLARDDTALELCRDLGIEDRLVPPAIFGAQIPWKGKMHSLPDKTLYGIPESPGAAMRVGLLGPLGAARARLDRVLPGPLKGPDISVGRLVKRRFGRQVLDRMVDPLLAGTRAGDANEMSLAAATPQIDEIARRHRSIRRGMAATRKSGTGWPPPFMAVKGGMQGLIDELGADVTRRAGVRTHARVEHISTGEHLSVYLERGERIGADSIVLAVPAYEAAEMVSGIGTTARDDLASIRYASAAVIALVYPDGALRPPAGASGVLVPSKEGATISACTWFDHKWPDCSVGDGRRVLRCFVGRRENDPALEMNDAELAVVVAADARNYGGATGDPISHRIVRWDRAMPQYAIGHLDVVDRIESDLAAHRIFVAGAGYRGSGIPDCIKQAKAAAAQAVAALTAR